MANWRRTAIKRINSELEREVLLRERSDLIARVGQCSGPFVIDVDYEEMTKRILSSDNLTVETQKQPLASFLPVGEVCGLQGSNEQQA